MRRKSNIPKVLWSSIGFFSIFKHTWEQIEHTQNVLLTRTFSLTSLITALWKLLWSVGTPGSGLCVGCTDRMPTCTAAGHPASKIPKGSGEAADSSSPRWLDFTLKIPLTGAVAKCYWKGANLCFYPVNSERWFCSSGNSYPSEVKIPWQNKLRLISSQSLSFLCSSGPYTKQEVTLLNKHPSTDALIQMGKLRKVSDDGKSWEKNPDSQSHAVPDSLSLEKREP